MRAVLIVALAFTLPAIYSCDVSASEPRLVFQTGVAGGGPLFLQGGGLPAQSTAPVTVVGRLRLWAPRYTPLGVETSLVPGYGIGFNSLVDVFHLGRFRLHLIDLGIFCDVWSPVTVGRVRREWDFTFGGGMEFRAWKSISITLDWRDFMPNPFRVLTDYGDFSRLVYREALQGGQLWLGFSWSWQR